jgi:hypothetical protein
MKPTNNEKKILLIEDSLVLGRRIVELIKTELELECEWLVRLKTDHIDGSILVGYRASGELDEVDLNNISIGLIDGNLGRDKEKDEDEIPGWKIVPDLVRKAKIRCVGIGADNGDILKASGCELVYDKWEPEFETFLRKDLAMLHAFEFIRAGSRNHI